MRIKSFLALTGLAAIAATSLLSCKPQGPSASHPIHVGVVLPLTGDAAQYGKALQAGADLAIEQINAAGDTNAQKLVLTYEDSKAEPTAAVSAVNKLIGADHVQLVIGDMFSSTTLAIAPIAQRNRVVLVSPTASAEAVPRVGDYIFSIYPSDAYDGQFLAEAIQTLWPDSTRVAIIYAQAEAMITAKDAFKKKLQGSRFQVVSEQAVPPGTKDLSSAVTTIQPADPQIVFIAAYLPETATFLRQAAQQGLKGKFVGISTCYDPKLFELAGAAANELIFSAPFFEADSTSPQVAPFVAAFKQSYGKAPDVWAAYGYDVVKIVAHALEKSGGDSEQLRRAIASTSNYQGATGTTSFTPDRGVNKELRLLKADASSRAFVPQELHKEN